MKAKEKQILKTAIERNRGVFSPAELINGIAQNDRQSVENLVVRGYLEIAPETIRGGTYNFYRITTKGLVELEPWYEKAWFNFKGDLRTILVSALTALVTLLATYLLGKLIK